jgi:hypothetical protein
MSTQVTAWYDCSEGTRASSSTSYTAIKFSLKTLTDGRNLLEYYPRPWSQSIQYHMKLLNYIVQDVKWFCRIFCFALKLQIGKDDDKNESKYQKYIY